MTRPQWAGIERARLGESIKRLAPGAAVIRVRPDGTLSAYRIDRTVIRGREKLRDRRIAELLRGYYGAVDWSVAHDYYVADGRLCTAPGAGERGGWPAVDGTFGSAPGPTTRKTPAAGAS